MPYEEHPVFKSPDNVNQKIWRYLKFRWYVDLLEKQALYFSRLDRLGDKFEGSITIPEMELRQSMRKTWVDRFSPILPQLTYDKILAEDSKFWEICARAESSWLVGLNFDSHTHVRSVEPKKGEGV